MKLWLLVLVVTWVGPCWASGEFERGRIYFEAKRGDLASREFRKQLDEKLTDEERANCLYNLATALISEGAYESAHEIMLQIRETDIQSKTAREALEENRLFLSMKEAEKKIEKQLDATQDLDDIQAKTSKLTTRQKASFQEWLNQLLARQKEMAYEATFFPASTLSLITFLKNEEEALWLFMKATRGKNDPLFLQSIKNSLKYRLRHFQALSCVKESTFMNDTDGWELLRSIFLLRCCLERKEAEKNGVEAEIKKWLEELVEVEWRADDRFWKDVQRKEGRRFFQFVSQKIHDLTQADKEDKARLFQAFLKSSGPLSCKEAFQLFSFLQDDLNVLIRSFVTDKNKSMMMHMAIEIQLQQQNKQALEAFKKGKIIESWLIFDRKMCLAYQIETLSRSFSLEGFDQLVTSWKFVKKEYSLEKVGAVDTALAYIQHNHMESNQSKLLWQILLYWMCVDDEEFEKKLSQVVQEAIAFEKNCLNVGEELATLTRQVTQDVLLHLMTVPLEKKLLAEIRQVHGMVESNSSFSMQKFIHTRVEELLEKILRFLQKSEEHNEAHTSQKQSEQKQDMEKQLSKMHPKMGPKPEQNASDIQQSFHILQQMELNDA
ncbi:MAG TPA: hypothetical protein VN457_05080, partial [Chlamydiales bacterium]|nr:hypothetical protein [Chlamydiales bacterium]